MISVPNKMHPGSSRLRELNDACGVNEEAFDEAHRLKAVLGESAIGHDNEVTAKANENCRALSVH